MNISAAEQCLHDRGRLAFAAAAAAGLPGQFRAFQFEGMLVLLTTSPGLDFLNSVSGVTKRSLDAVPDVLTTFASAGAPPPALTSVEPARALNEQLRSLGFTPSEPRPAAVIDLPAHTNRSRPGDERQLRVSEADTDDELPLFLDILAAGYAAPTQLSAFMRIEHSAAALRRFLAWRGDEPVATAAMSLHGEVAVLGGAATLPTARSAGAQFALLHHRLHQAADAGCTAATATAAPDSPSLRNLTRVGFTVSPRASWRTGPWPAQR
jgi:GNAT superfamily N-acetyltransferase